MILVPWEAFNQKKFFRSQWELCFASLTATVQAGADVPCAEVGG